MCGSSSSAGSAGIFKTKLVERLRAQKAAAPVTPPATGIRQPIAAMIGKQRGLMLGASSVAFGARSLLG